MSEPPYFQDRTVLVVDEGAYARKLMRDMLGRVGIRRIVEAPDGAEALSALAEVRPEIVILSWDLPILNGEEFVRLARTPATSPAPTVSIILTVTKPQKGIVDRAISLGVNEILVRPFSPKALWARLNEVINKPRDFVETDGGLLRPSSRREGHSAAA